MANTNLRPSPAPREGLTWRKILRFLSLPFCPGHLKTYLAVQRFEDIPIERLLNDGVEGVLLDADGTLVTHHGREIADSVVRHVDRMVAAGLRVAIFTNAFEDRFDRLSGVGVVKDVPPKPDPRGFEIAMKHFLKLDDPARVCMIGDSYITDGGAISAGMRFIYVRPLPGRESWIHSAARRLGALCARLYWPGVFRNPPLSS